MMCVYEMMAALHKKLIATLIRVRDDQYLVSNCINSEHEISHADLGESLTNFSIMTSETISLILLYARESYIR